MGGAALIREMKRILADGRLPVLDILSFYLLPSTDIDEFTAALELGAELGGKYVMAIGDDPSGRACATIVDLRRAA